jgi:hypothetical protein
VAGACKTLDPIEAAEAGIAGSKDLIAAVARDLGQHQRWLAHYHVAEKRHARRLMIQDLLYRLEFARRRLVRMLTRLELRSFRLARAIALTLTNAALTILARLRRAAIAAVEWLRPRAYALSLKFWGWLVAFGARAEALSRATALIVRNWLAASFAWGLATSCVVARETMKHASAASAWLSLGSRQLARLLQKRLAVAWFWTLLNGAAAARATGKGAYAGTRWTAATSRSVAASLWRWMFRTAKRTRAQGRVLARLSRNGTSLVLSWIAASSRAFGVKLRRSLVRTRRKARVLAHASVVGASNRSASIAATSRSLAASLQSASSTVTTWTASAASTSARNSVAAASAAYAWGSHNAKAMSRGAWRAKPQSPNGHRALVVRQCTALVCFEPPRGGLPAIRGAPAMFSSPGAHASP